MTREPDLAGLLIVEADRYFDRIKVYARDRPFDLELQEAVADVHRAAMLYLEAIGLMIPAQE